MLSKFWQFLINIEIILVYGSTIPYPNKYSKEIKTDTCVTISYQHNKCEWKDSNQYKQQKWTNR